MSNVARGNVARGNVATGRGRGVAQLQRGSVLRRHGRRGPSCALGVRGTRPLALDGGGPAMAPRRFSE